MSQENVDLVLESIRRFRPSGLDEWAELWHCRLTASRPMNGPAYGVLVLVFQEGLGKSELLQRVCAQRGQGEHLPRSVAGANAAASSNCGSGELRRYQPGGPLRDWQSRSVRRATNGASA